ncbi:suppressor of cytokine signaling 3a [Gadus morhua]|uniref:Suppressor of cytokine signaling 3 n=1 Tax=Gadus morhua TaxID=8049 RepID=A0A8C5CIM2_GADMO|nr:suppressor of cytokine signaling 3 [Gadus morhua]
MVTYSKLTSAMSGVPLDPSPRPPQRYKTFSGRPQYTLVLAALRKLQESGFYWGAITGKDANALLSPEAPGTFLVRDSSDHRHFFTLSVRTAADTKNLRVQCDAASFFLQTDAKSAHAVPRFGCVLQLVHYYMSHGRGGAGGAGNGRCGGGNSYYIYSGGVKTPLELLRPLPSTLSSLQHLCRKTVNGHLDAASRSEQLPHTLKEFLQEYDAPI